MNEWKKPSMSTLDIESTKEDKPIPAECIGHPRTIGTDSGKPVCWTTKETNDDIIPICGYYDPRITICYCTYNPNCGY